MLAHLYRGEMYRSKIWRTRLDATTNWAVATTGIALSVSFGSPANSPLPLVLVSLMSIVFLSIEARRYRYFDIWRTRVRLMEVSMFVPLLRLEGVRVIKTGIASWLMTTNGFAFILLFGKQPGAGYDAIIRFFLQSKLSVI